MDEEDWSSRDLQSTLRICTLLQSVRELYASRTSRQLRAVFENHLLALILELLPAEKGAVLLEERAASCGDESAELLAEAARQRSTVTRQTNGRPEIATPLFVRKEFAGAIYLARTVEGPPFSETEVLLISAVAQICSLALENAFQVEFLQEEVKRLESNADLESVLVGASAKIVELREKVMRIASRDVTVLITGESGTGKELVARALHQHSMRARKPFVAINCAALTETLLESELFGHERGAFTGAVAQKRGRLEAADGGTMFLDEVGEMPLALQAKLLRVLQQREFERVGGTRTIPLDIRLIAATNRNLEQAIRQGVFRQDLFYRLNVISLTTPPLRERPEDILVLANRFAGRFGGRMGRMICGISPEARGILRSYTWPGNVRELENAMESAVILGSSEMILAEDLPESLRTTSGGMADGTKAGEGGMLDDAIHAAKRAVVQRALDQAQGDHIRAARLLGVHPNYLYRLLKAVDVSAAMFKVSGG